MPDRTVSPGIGVARSCRRRGIAVLWAVLVIPILLILIGGVVHIGNVWLARVELENALEAAALAAVKEWGDAGGGDTEAARNVGVAFAAANRVRCQPVVITSNLKPDPVPVTNPNENLSCSGNLIFGSITDDSPVTFNAGMPAGCIPARVVVDITKPSEGADPDPEYFGISYDQGPPLLSIRSVSITLPTVDKQPVQQPFFDGTKLALVSTTSVRGLDPDPVTLPDNWLCPSLPPPVTNPNGDTCMGFSDEILPGRFRTLTIHFKDGAFTSTNNPATTDFIRYGASINQMNPPALPPGSQNNGEAFHKDPVLVTVTFFYPPSLTLVAKGHFIDDGDSTNGRSVAPIGGGAGYPPAVRAQATVPIRSLGGCLLGLDPCTNVSACVIAMYDCNTGKPRLMRVEEYICPGPYPWSQE